MMERGPTAPTVLRELQQLGVGIVLDDFGTGWSSLSRLRHLPITGLKVDRSFVAELRAGRGHERADRRGHRADEPRARPRLGGRGHRDARAGRPPARAGLPLGAGLPASRGRWTRTPPAGCSRRAPRCRRRRAPARLVVVLVVGVVRSCPSRSDASSCVVPSLSSSASPRVVSAGGLDLLVVLVVVGVVDLFALDRHRAVLVALEARRAELLLGALVVAVVALATAVGDVLRLVVRPLLEVGRRLVAPPPSSRIVSCAFSQASSFSLARSAAPSSAPRRRCSWSSSLLVLSSELACSCSVRRSLGGRYPVETPRHH